MPISPSFINSCTYNSQAGPTEGRPGASGASTGSALPARSKPRSSGPSGGPIMYLRTHGRGGRRKQGVVHTLPAHDTHCSIARPDIRRDLSEPGRRTRGQKNTQEGRPGLDYNNKRGEARPARPVWGRTSRAGGGGDLSRPTTASRLSDSCDYFGVWSERAGLRAAWRVSSAWLS